MKRWVATVAMALGLLGVLVAPTHAQQARHVRVVIDDTFPDPFLTEACGTPVQKSVEGTLNVTLIYNQEGLLVKEIDPSGGSTVTYSAPETGNSFSFPFQTVIFDYGAGAEVGSTFTAKFVGLFGQVPKWVHATGGLEILTGGFVTGFDDNGIPLLDFETAELVVEHVNRPSGEDLTAAICAVLTA
jgi:hypothetical protein